MILAEGLTHCRNIEHFTFKFIEQPTHFLKILTWNRRTPISFEYVCQFVKIIAELGSFSSFDLFFRRYFGRVFWTDIYRLEYSYQGRLMIENILSRIRNVEYVLTKESLHIYKKKGFSNWEIGFYCWSRLFLNSSERMIQILYFSL